MVIALNIQFGDDASLGLSAEGGRMNRFVTACQGDDQKVVYKENLFLGLASRDRAISRRSKRLYWNVCFVRLGHMILILPCLHIQRYKSSQISGIETERRFIENDN
jgi:hypothetical protein